MSRHNSLQKVNISEEGRRIAKKYYEEKQPISELPEMEGVEDKVPEQNKKYLRFQVEMEAGKIQKTETPPEHPGKIPKLPVLKSWMDEEVD